MPIGLALRAARARSGLTQGDLASRLGVTQGAVSLWESGAETPTVEHIIALSAELPEVLEALPEQERELLRRLLRLERQLFPGKCACPNCRCGDQGT